tara:strand:+ start:645 stop:1532 length:888 start_codon:yes stop_codon:yes gene_type:complete
MNKTKKFKKLMCSPHLNKTKKNKYTCYNDKHIYKLKKIWNNRFPDNKINSKNKKKIWNHIKKNMLFLCDNEKCWFEKLLGNHLKFDFFNYFAVNDYDKIFAPFAPSSWKTNRKEWLSSIDLHKVMKQYELSHPNFIFLGVSPIDYDTIKNNGNCVTNNICNFNMQDIVNKNIDKIGIIFNTDPHYKRGSHWISLFIDLKKKFIYYFDSNGDKEPNQIKKLIKTIQKKAIDVHPKLNLEFYNNYPLKHQNTDGECGVYCLYFLIKLIKNSNMKTFHTKKISDSLMNKYRKKLFNII